MDIGVYKGGRSGMKYSPPKDSLPPQPHVNPPGGEGGGVLLCPHSG